MALLALLMALLALLMALLALLMAPLALLKGSDGSAGSARRPSCLGTLKIKYTKSTVTTLLSHHIHQTLTLLHKVDQKRATIPEPGAGGPGDNKRRSNTPSCRC